jgi:hypothetical protein
MAIDTSLFVNIVSQLKDKGIRDTEKGLKNLSARTNNLTRQLGVLARRVAVFETLRRSFKAFVEDEAAARRLNVTLNNLGLSFSALAAEDYIASLERTSRVLDDQLRPAFETISRATGDFAKSQEILNLALDVAAGTGADVVTVSRALSRAYAGNTTTLSRLNAGLTKAELATGDFAVIQEKLNSLFRGQNAALLDTYQGKINGLRVAFANAGEAVGKGLVDGVTALAGGDVQNAINFIVRAGEAIGDAFRFASRQVAFVKEIFTRQDFFGAESQLELFEKFRKIDDPAKIRASARERRKALEEENKTAQKIARTRAKAATADKKAAADAKKAEQDKLKLLEAGELFDDERISVAAALKNESLDRNEILRLELKQALINENANRAEILANRLKDSQRELSALANFRLANPFQEWEDSLARIRAGMASIGAPVASITTQGTVSGQMPLVPSAVPGQSGFIGPEITQDVLDDVFGRGAVQAPATININVTGTGDLSDDTKKKIVDTIIDYSSIGYSTSGWYRTTGNIAL